MALVYTQDINPQTKLGVWHIVEDENFFADVAPVSRNISHVKKRLQHLAGRKVLSELFPVFPMQDILIAESNRPYLEREDYFFSISHCGEYAAAIVSEQHAVGLDIELITPKIELVKDKFLSPEEQQILGKEKESWLKLLTAAWSVKEAFFKWYGKGNVDFKEDMVLQEMWYDGKDVFAKLHFKKEVGRVMQAQGMWDDELVMVWVVGR